MRKGFFRVLIDEKMAAGNRAVLHVRQARCPDLGHVKCLVHHAVSPRQNQRRAGDLPAEVSRIQIKITAQRRAVILAHGADRFGFTPSLAVCCKLVGRKVGQLRRPPTQEARLIVIIGVSSDQTLREWCGLSQKNQ